MKKLLKLSEHPIIAGLLIAFILSIGYGAIVEKLGVWLAKAKSIFLYVCLFWSIFIYVCFLFLDVFISDNYVIFIFDYFIQINFI